MTQGVCLCGCGGTTSLITRSCARRGLIRGQYRRYVHGHHVVRGQPASLWKDGRYTTVKGYRMDRHAGKFEHVLLVEAAIGKPLRADAEVHHANGKRADNSAGNLVACDSHVYHMLLHQRQKALDACGSPDWMRCRGCGTYGPPSQMRRRSNGPASYYFTHPACPARPSAKEIV